MARPLVGLRFGRIEGFAGMGEELALQTMKDAVAAIERSLDKLVERARQKLSVGMEGPSAPGIAPALHEGMIRDGIGRTKVFVNKGAVRGAWGFGVGPEAIARIRAHAARRGEEFGNMFAIALMNEYGTVNYDLARTHPQRPFIRNTEQEMQGRVVAEMEAAYL